MPDTRKIGSVQSAMTSDYISTITVNLDDGTKLQLFRCDARTCKIRPGELTGMTVDAAYTLCAERRRRAEDEEEGGIFAPHTPLDPADLEVEVMIDGHSYPTVYDSEVGCYVRKVGDVLISVEIVHIHPEVGESG